MSDASGASAPQRGLSRVRLAIIGFGGQGIRLADTARTIPGASLVAAADLYDGRLERAREVAGDSLPTTRDYRQILERRDVDAVVIATPDHWHAPILADAVAAGKDVYCEAPVIHRQAELTRLLEQVPPDRIVQGGGGWVTSPLFSAARALIAEGRLGRVLDARATWDTHTSLAAWQTPFPPDASPETIDYATFAGAAAGPAGPFDLYRFFRWRCYRRFGSGLAGARFAPLLTALHWLLDIGMPTSLTAAGALQRWKDGREVPDTLAATLVYPEQLVVTVSASLSGSAPPDIRISGTEASLVIRDREIVVEAAPQVEPYTEVAETWAREYRDWFYMMHGMTAQGQVRGGESPERTVERFALPAATSAAAPLAEFVESVRTRRSPREGLALAATAAAVALRIDEAAAAGCAAAAEQP